MAATTNKFPPHVPRDDNDINLELERCMFICFERLSVTTTLSVLGRYLLYTFDKIIAIFMLANYVLTVSVTSKKIAKM